MELFKGKESFKEKNLIQIVIEKLHGQERFKSNIYF